MLQTALERQGRQDAVKVCLVTDLSAPSLAAKSLDTGAILDTFSRLPRTSLTHLPRLHAKVYVADEKCAIVTSANLTDGGLFFNYEFGVRFDDPVTVRKVREDAEGYASLGGEVLREELVALDQTAHELQRLHEQADRQINARLRTALARHMSRAHLNLLRIRARGKTTHGIFTDTLLYLLRRGPRRTADLHRLIQQIHPDLCDDSVDRIIDGVHFGKKWKHYVRTAQQHLKRRGLIFHERGTWYAASGHQREH
jgi:phosphatidylserine/phosphatidylglycerophosphate/cardiolipin synthase-like enzyme